MTEGRVDIPGRRVRPRMPVFLRALLALTFLAHLPVFAAALAFARRIGLSSPWLCAALYASAGMTLFLGRARAGMPDHRRPSWLVWLVDVPYFVHWCACAWSLIPALLYTVLGPFVVRAATGELGLPLDPYLWLYASGLLTSAYGIYVRRRFFVVRHLDVVVPGLPTAFDGYRVAHLSDLHIGSTTPRAWGERWVRAANATSPDLAVITGDLVTSGTDFHRDIAAVVRGLVARDGVVVSMGNHDYFGEGEPLISLLRDGGARVLRNAGFTLSRGEGALHVAALDDTWTRRADLDRALGDRPAGVTTVLLAHDPDRFPDAAARGVSLVLSGHTHGGQIAVPFLSRWLTLSRLSHKFHVGLYRIGDAVLHVHPGLGTTGPPIRLGVAPAVVVLTLRSG